MPPEAADVTHLRLLRLQLLHMRLLRPLEAIQTPRKRRWPP